jgi:hypothetical protein
MSNSLHVTRAWCLLLTSLLFLASCGSSAPSTHTAAVKSHPTSLKPLDSIAVLGHSGTTGYDSDPNKTGTDVRGNSWVTGNNPIVNSLYRRLLATHPALGGHAFNHGEDGSDVDQLSGQVDQVLADRPLPGLVVIQSIDNDIACDGTDPQNYAPYAKKLHDVLARLYAGDHGVQVFMVDQWGSVARYTRAVAQRPDLVRVNTGHGRCDLFTTSGKARPAAERYLQQQVDAYFARIEQVCASFPRCWTDRSALQGLRLTGADLTSDGNHLTIAGLAKMASLAWTSLPHAVKNRD